MSGFGGSVKLTGESEYRKALSQITQDLKGMSSALKAQATDFATSDKSMSSTVAKQKELAKSISEQQAAVDKAKSSLAQYTVALQTQQTRHNELNREYRNAILELDRIGKASGTTSEEYQKQAKVVDQLEGELVESTDEMNRSRSAMSALKSEISNASKTIDSATRDMDDLGAETEETGKSAKRASEGFTVFRGILANLASQAITAAINALRRLANSIVTVGRQSYAAYGEYEQLVGGVETLFGESANALIAYASEAYKTAGISANKYMEQATSFSATLLQGLSGDTASAVEYANMAIIDMSDNANKMGTDMSSIQNAYQGFAKNNYTMLDNLKLGYSGTAGEMARLINDSGVLGDAVKVTATEVKNVPFNKVIEAIHKVQQEIGITGTTTLEAEHTITGSTASMNAAWQNLLVGIANDNADVKPLIDDFVEQVVTMGHNMVPRIKAIIEGMGDLVSAVWNDVIPELAEDIPQLQPIVDAMDWIKENADLIVSGLASILAGFVAFKAVTFIGTIASGVSALFGAVQAGVPIMQALNLALSANPIGLIVTAVAALVAGFITLWNTSDEFRQFWIDLWEKIKTTFTDVWDAVTVFFTTTIPEAFNSVKETIGEWKDKVVAFFQQIPEKISDMIDNAITFLKELPYNLGFIVGEALGHLIMFGADAWQWVTTKIPEIIDGIVNFFKELPGKVWTWLKDTYNKTVQWGKDTVAKAKEAGKNFVDNVITFFKELPGKVWTWLTNTIAKVGTFAVDIAKKAKQGAKDMYDNIVNGVKSLPDKLKSIGHDIVTGLWNGISGMADWVLSKIRGFGQGILNGMKSVLGIHSPSTVFRDVVGKNLALGIGEGFSDEMRNVTRQMGDAIPTDFDVNTTVSKSRTASNEDIIEALKDALKELKIELDDETVGRFVDKTVTRLVYA